MRALEDPAPGEDGKSSWEAFKQGFWAAVAAAANKKSGGAPSLSSSSSRGADAGAGAGIGGARGRQEEAYRTERNVRMGRLTGFLTQFTSRAGGDGSQGEGAGRAARAGGPGGGGGLSAVSHHLAENAVVLPPPPSSSFPGEAVSEMATGVFGASGCPATTASATGDPGDGAGVEGEVEASTQPRPNRTTAPAPAPPRRLPPLDLSNLSLRQRAEMGKHADRSG